MLIWESKQYHCADCDFVLYYESREIFNRRRMMLVHPRHPICGQSDKVFYLPKIDLTEFSVTGLNELVVTESTAPTSEPK